MDALSALDRSILDYLAERPHGSPSSWLAHGLGDIELSATLRWLERRGLVCDTGLVWKLVKTLTSRRPALLRVRGGTVLPLERGPGVTSRGSPHRREVPSSGSMGSPPFSQEVGQRILPQGMYTAGSS